MKINEKLFQDELKDFGYRQPEFLQYLKDRENKMTNPDNMTKVYIDNIRHVPTKDSCNGQPWKIYADVYRIEFEENGYYFKYIKFVDTIPLEGLYSRILAENWFVIERPFDGDS